MQLIRYLAWLLGSYYGILGGCQGITRRLLSCSRGFLWFCLVVARISWVVARVLLSSC